MSLLVRKFSRSKWPKANYESFSSNDISADAITSCLRTSNNTLSTWEIESKDQVQEAVLALVSGFERLDTIDIVIFEKEKLINNGFEIVATPGITPIEDLVDTHKDIVKLNYQSIGSFAELVLDCLANSSVQRITRTEVKKILINAIEKDRLDSALLKKGIREKLAI